MKYNFTNFGTCVLVPLQKDTLSVSLYTSKFRRHLRENYTHRFYGTQYEIDRLLSLILLVCKVENLNLSTFSSSNSTKKTFSCLFESKYYKKNEQITIQDICASTGLHEQYRKYYERLLKNQKVNTEVKKVQRNETTIEQGLSSEWIERVDSTLISHALNMMTDYIVSRVNSRQEISKQLVDQYIWSRIDRNSLNLKTYTVLVEKISRFWSYISQQLASKDENKKETKEIKKVVKRKSKELEDENQVFSDIRFPDLYLRIQEAINFTDDPSSQNTLKFTSGRVGRTHIDHSWLTTYLLDIILANKEVLSQGWVVDVSKLFREEYGIIPVRYEWFHKITGELTQFKRRPRNIKSSHSYGVAMLQYNTMVKEKAKKKAREVIDFWFWIDEGNFDESGLYTLMITKDKRVVILRK